MHRCTWIVWSLTPWAPGLTAGHVGVEARPLSRHAPAGHANDAGQPRHAALSTAALLPIHQRYRRLFVVVAAAGRHPCLRAGTTRGPSGFARVPSVPPFGPRPLSARKPSRRGNSRYATFPVRRTWLNLAYLVYWHFDIAAGTHNHALRFGVFVYITKRTETYAIGNKRRPQFLHQTR